MLCVHSITCTSNSQQDTQCGYKRNTKERSCNNWCRVKAVGVICFEYVCCLSNPARKAHAPYYIVICGLYGCVISTHIISYTSRFSGGWVGGGKLLSIKWDLIFSTILVWIVSHSDRLRVSGYRYRGLGFDSRRYQIFWVVVGLERGPLSLVRSIEELLE